jgi:alanyl-tRNA synthetase
MTARELRDKYLRFFESKSHSLHASGSLIPIDVTGRLDESLLFNGAGMVQFKPYFRGVATPPSPRLTNSQKCVRTGDIDDVGDLSHLTFFEMLGNFSFGDYFKAEAIAYSWEFMTSKEWLGLDPQRLSFTVFEEDDEAYTEWSKHLSSAGIEPSTRIFKLTEQTNYWPAGAFSSGPPGPCGPNSEMFFWTPNDEPAPTGPYTREDYLRDEKAGKWLEIWNDVFIQYEWKGHLRRPDRPGDGYEKEGMEPLPFRSVDTGMGLERTATVLLGHDSVYDTDLFQPIIRLIEQVGRGETERDAGRGTRDAGGEARENFENESANEQANSLRTSEQTRTNPNLHLGREVGIQYGDDPEKDRAIRIIADHIRTACFCIADGILPSNTGRGYVLRRLIRRAVLKGQRVLGFDQPFFHKVYEAVAEVMGGHYTELIERREIIVETLQNEEAQFRRTVASGTMMLFEQTTLLLTEVKSHIARSLGKMGEIHPVPGSIPSLENPSYKGLNDDYSGYKVTPGDFSQLKTIYPSLLRRIERQCPESDEREELTRRLRKPSLSGADAFRLYDTYGFPLEVTVELCAEAGLEVDIEGYEKAMAEAQERSRGADGMDTVYGGYDEDLVLSVSDAANTETIFVGYDQLECEAKVAQISPRFGPDGLTTGDIQVCLDQTPFYAESGGQVGDTGTITCADFEFKVTKTWKDMGLVWHDVELMRGPHLKGLQREGVTELLNSGVFFKVVTATVDRARRKAITRNHTATHLLHAALRSVLGTHVTQAGSLVHPDHLRFDFTHGKAMTAKEIAQVEKIVNERALDDRTVTVHVDLPIDKAKEMGAMALFGEKYGDRVRMVEVDGFSKELCGGCHVGRTGEIGLIKIVSESSAAGGVRRIEAITGAKAYEWVNEQQNTLREASTLLKAQSDNLLGAIEKTLEQLKDEKRKREKAEAAMVRGGASTTEAGQEGNAYTPVGDIQLWAKRYDSIDPKIVATAIDDAVSKHTDLVAIAAIINDGKVNLVCKVGADAQKKGAHAGNLIKEVAKIVGGGGGGRPDFATAGGKDASKVDQALKEAVDLVGKQLNN